MQQIELETTRARESLRKEVAGIAVGAASKLLGREIDASRRTLSCSTSSRRRSEGARING